MDGIGSRIRLTRDNWELTQKEFAKRIGVTNAHVSAMEKGKTIPSHALVKLICKEFLVNERWLLNGMEPTDLDELEAQTERSLESTYARLNLIRTRDNMPIRSRVAQLEEIFVEMLDIDVSDALREEYYDVFYKVFYHLNSYLEFQKNTLKSSQTHIFSFPDDVAENIKTDITFFDLFFIKAAVGDEPMDTKQVDE